MQGKILILKEKALHIPSKSWDMMNTVLYQVCKVDPDRVATNNIEDFHTSEEDDVIIAVGDGVLQALCGIKGIMKYAGTVQSYEGIPVVPICSPSYLDHAPNYLRLWAEHIQLAVNISMGIKQEEATNQFLIVRDLGT